jgi:hypothetical protein
VQQLDLGGQRQQWLDGCRASFGNRPRQLLGGAQSFAPQLLNLLSNSKL